jgi:sulfonate transport system substrate-binding protein
MATLSNNTALCVGVMLAVLGVPASAALAQGTTIRIGWSTPGEEAKYMMMGKPSLFPALGTVYRPQWAQFKGSTPIAQGMLAGAVDCGVLGPAAFGAGVVEGNLQAYIVAQHGSLWPGYFAPYLAVREDSGIRSIADLKGKVVGVNAYGSGIHTSFVIWLRRQGIDPRDVRVVEVGFPPMEDAIRSSRIDAGFLVQPFAHEAEKTGKLRTLFRDSDLQNDKVTLFEACRKEFVDQNPDVAKQYVRDITAGMVMALQDKPEAYRVTARVTKVPVASIQTYLLTEGDFYHDPEARPNLQSIQVTLDILHQENFLAKAVDVRQYVRSDILAPLK